MNKIVITTALPSDSLSEKVTRVQNYLTKVFGGYTVVETFGGWVDPSEVCVEEFGKQYTVFTEQGSLAAEQAALTIRDTFNQQCVVLEFNQDVSFI